MARLVFLGRLEELAGAPELAVSVATLADGLAALPEGLRGELTKGKVRFALNGAVLPSGTDPASVGLGEDDEVALLPPVSGG